MDFFSLALSALLFTAFVPGFLVTLPARGSRTTIILVHSALFALVLHLVMKFYHHQLEKYMNYGPAGCPKGYTAGMNQGGVMDCVLHPAGKALLKTPMPAN
jgi:hypothetical protein